MNQLELHKKIDALLVENPAEVKPEEASALISANGDAKQYFYDKADERWLDWLQDNGFLDVIKEKAEDPTRYGYRTPELNYLMKVAEKEPAKVVDIMLDVQISAENFNPEVVDRFLGICRTLPAKQLARIVPKIRDERWIQLMEPFNQWAFMYEKILQTLSGAKDYESILIVAEAILAVRTKEEIKMTDYCITDDKPFYFKDLSYTKVFKHLVSVDSAHVGAALKLVADVVRKVVLLGGENELDHVFSVDETYHLFDVDFFELELSEKEPMSRQDDARSLAAVIKILGERLIGERCDDPENARAIYEQYFMTLPDSRSMWRLRLFILSLCPGVFKDKLKESFFRIFETDHYHEFISGTEYKKALRLSFPVLSEDEKREYVNRVLEYFSKHAQDSEKEEWHKKYGWEILSSICVELTEEENKKCEKVFGSKCDPKFDPQPTIGRMFAGSVRPRGPITQEEFGNLSIADIAKKMRGEWKPEKLRSKNTNDDFLNPLNAEGVSGLLRADISRRLQEYINNANLFFERDVLDEHYTYSFLRGIQEIFREKRVDVSNVNWDDLITLCIAIEESGEGRTFDPNAREKDTFDAWLSGWESVHSAMADVVQGMIGEHDGKFLIDFSVYRDRLFSIVSYLLDFPDPTPDGEKIESAKMKTKSPSSEEYLVSDPYSMAINTVRGRAFQALALFVYQDGKKFAKDEKVKISPDVKKLYETVLKNEETRALMFMFGHYLPSFYFRDKEWMGKLLPQIFPAEPNKKDLYLSAWEGYLTNNLYEEIFFNPRIQKLYERAIALSPEEYTKRKYFRELDDGLAIHLALAFMHYEGFGFDTPLFKAFWGSNSERYTKFISFLGRSFVSGDNAATREFLEKEPRARRRLREFWDWSFDNCEDPKSFAEFAFWINTGKAIFDTPWLAEHVRKTLEKTDGFLEWDYGLMMSISVLAKAAPADTLSIVRLRLLNNSVRGEDQRRGPLYIDNEWFEAFQILYNNPSTKEGAYTLIDDLIREGGSTFWKLKEVLSDEVI